MTELKFTSKDLIERWRITWVDLVKYIRTSDGELQPYDSYGNMLVDPTTPYGYGIFRELFPQTQIERPDLFESKSSQKIPDHILNGIHGEPETLKYRRFNQFIKWQLIDIVFEANNIVKADFTMPTDDIAADIFIIGASWWLFKTSDVLNYEKKHDLKRTEHISNGLPEVEQPLKETSPDDFIKELVLHPVNDNEIQFQVGQKRAIFHIDDRLGKRGKEQKRALKEILDDPKHIYSLGPTHDKKYYRRLQRIKELSKKIIDFLNKEFAANIPADYFLFERFREEGTGIYKPIFQIFGSIERERENIEKLRKNSVQALKKKLKILITDSSKQDVDQIPNIIKILKEKNVQGEDLDELVHQYVRRGEIIASEFSEHPPLFEPGMSINGSHKKIGPPDEDEKVE